MLKVSEIFRSIQGESTFQGWPCTFIRLAGCNLSCNYCDTDYAKNTGQNLTIEDIIDKTKQFSTSGFVEITGGEPLLQEETIELSSKLFDEGFQVLIETNGSLDIKNLDSRIIKIVDFKSPSSGQSSFNYYENIKYLNIDDEVKFVLTNREDYEWAVAVTKKHNLENKCKVLFSAVTDTDLQMSELAKWILEDDLNVRIHNQLHKIIWGKDTRK